MSLFVRQWWFGFFGQGEGTASDEGFDGGLAVHGTVCEGGGGRGDR